jgi:hypothetical protein
MGLRKLHCGQRSLLILLQLREPATALSRKFLHDLMTARHLEQRFQNKIPAAQQQFSVHGSISVCTAVHMCNLEGTLIMVVKFF